MRARAVRRTATAAGAGRDAALVQALDRMAGWLREAGAGGAGSGVVQSEALAALAGQKEHLDALALLWAETCQLLGACSGAVTPAAATADQAAALGCALGAACAATEAATACKRRLDAALAACAVSVPAAAEAGEAAFDGLTWATQAAVDAAAANKAALAAASAELTAALERVDGAAAAPGVEALAAALLAAATDAAATLEPLVGAAAATDVAADGAAPSGEVAEVAEALVRSLLVWAQPGQAQQATKAAAHGADAGAAKGSANPQALVRGTAEHEAGLKLPRGREEVGVGARVLVTENCDLSAGTANGATGTVVALEEGPDVDDAAVTLVKCIRVKMDWTQNTVNLYARTTASKNHNGKTYTKHAHPLMFRLFPFPLTTNVFLASCCPLLLLSGQ